jgi:hypothetical protein
MHVAEEEAAYLSLCLLNCVTWVTKNDIAEADLIDGDALALKMHV